MELRELLNISSQTRQEHLGLQEKSKKRCRRFWATRRGYLHRTYAALAENYLLESGRERAMEKGSLPKKAREKCIGIKITRA